MVTIAADTEEQEVSDFTPLTAAEAKALREQHPSLSPWWVVAGQLVVGVLVALIAWAVTESQTVGVSAACGALAVIVPAALFARGVTGQFASANAGSAVLSFFVWEMVKIFVTVGIMFAAHRLVAGLSWPAMLLGLVVTMKVYWIALGFKRKPKPGANTNA
ncbi:ATP synthase subunit I [Rhodoferax lacus]|uniref:ATP synthase subunit I n=1 Tax=Rhodoferax lacus TaxID=2184758 RepID=A0A3E1R6W2_9BURK|nr:ATP synthase subunit I [Rhodoferax lacus]RFO94782.1 ATP synthase subunit I [Rhodoferax lacus]